jgi:hypothetical protein
MHPLLNAYLANALAQDRLEAAERFRRSRVEWAEETPDPYPAVTVRLARNTDAEAVIRLSELDGRRVPPAPVLVAEVGGDLLAARSLKDGAAVADPFRPTGHLAELLELRSAHLRNGSDGYARGGHRGRRWLRALVATTRS